jgi:hypothetical protein
MLDVGLNDAILLSYGSKSSWYINLYVLMATTLPLATCRFRKKLVVKTSEHCLSEHVIRDKLSPKLSLTLQ